ncbi:MAG: hypothetical protein A2W91_17225 [Bacteroidetes bacterium GWF2_38_335]|nr:MAG: hypothetical protein A2W91_17225 [Bacteroidetes bacterium GWF2_38_335]OFY81423.1 MAG: hypothetical protein A2281_08200 [Bacteroidetes bacterium RIFOXYA12_FULL_38_20]HBS85552.1 hypothetical protein [Bacteroidales bacterium]
MRNTLLFILISILIFSCSKYEDGPNITFRSSQKRLENGTWHSQTLIYKSTESDIPDMYLVDFSLDGYDGYYDIVIGGDQLSGTCRLTEENTRIEFLTTTDTTGIDTIPETILSSWKILRLKNKELWIETNFENNDLEMLFKKE